MPIKALLLDIDGTLVDSNEQHVSAWDDAFRQFRYEFDRQAIHDQVGKGGDNLVPALIPEVTADEVEKLSHAEGEAFKTRYRDGVRPFPGARGLIERARADGLAVVLASSASREELDYWVELLDVGRLVTGTTSRDDVEHSKPAPDIFRAALDRIAPVQSWEAVVIGDTPYDLQAARKNAIGTIAVRSGGFPDESLRPHSPLAIYDDVAALLADYEASPIYSSVETALSFSPTSLSPS